jgi:hypothetical protein
MGFMSKKSFDAAYMALNSAKFAMKVAQQRLDHAKAKHSMRLQNKHERQNKYDRAEKKAQNASDQAKIARLQVALGKQNQAAVEGRRSSALKKEVEEARKAAEEAQERVLQDDGKIRKNIDSADVLLNERRHKVRKAQAEMNEAEGEKAKAERMLIKEKEVKGDKRILAANERKTKGKDLVRNFARKESADRQQEAEFEAELGRRRFVVKVKVSPLTQSRRSRKKLEEKLAQRKRQAARRLKRQTEFADWVMDGNMKDKEAHTKWRLAKESLADAVAIRQGTKEERDSAKAALAEVDRKRDAMEDRMQLAETEGQRAKLRSRVDELDSMQEKRLTDAKVAGTRMRYASKMVKEREAKLLDAKQRKIDADERMQARDAVA